MVTLVDLRNPNVCFYGKIFWDMLRPGVRLTVMGDNGCTTSPIRRVVPLSYGRYYIYTKNSRYLLSEGRKTRVPHLAELKDVSTAAA